MGFNRDWELALPVMRWGLALKAVRCAFRSWAGMLEQQPALPLLSPPTTGASKAPTLEGVQGRRGGEEGMREKKGAVQFQPCHSSVTLMGAGKAPKLEGMRARKGAHPEAASSATTPRLFPHRRWREGSSSPSPPLLLLCRRRQDLNA